MIMIINIKGEKRKTSRKMKEDISIRQKYLNIKIRKVNTLMGDNWQLSVTFFFPTYYGLSFVISLDAQQTQTERQQEWSHACLVTLKTVTTFNSAHTRTRHNVHKPIYISQEPRSCPRHNLSMQAFVSRTVQSCQYQLHCISQIRKYLSTEATAKLVIALILTRIDYCNPPPILHHSNSSALPKQLRTHIILWKRKSKHITPVLQALCWLPVPKRIMYKLNNNNNCSTY